MLEKINFNDDDRDWDSFSFPPKPVKKTDSISFGEDNLAPDWAQPPKEIKTWHLDLERLLIIHPVLRKKIDLTKINTRQRLVQLAKLITKQPSPEDGFALLCSIDDAIQNSWSISLPEMISLAPDRWEWPREQLLPEDADADQ